MKNQDDGTLSLFDDFPLAPTATTPATPAKETAPKKPRAKRKAAESVAEPSATDAETPFTVTSTTADNPSTEDAPELAPVDHGTQIETTLHLAGLVEPQRRRNSPWATIDIAPLQAAAQIPHVMLVITKGEAGGAQSHVLALSLIHI
jgi:hypothetical protein